MAYNPNAFYAVFNNSSWPQTEDTLTFLDTARATVARYFQHLPVVHVKESHAIPFTYAEQQYELTAVYDEVRGSLEVSGIWLTHIVPLGESPR